MQYSKHGNYAEYIFVFCCFTSHIPIAVFIDFQALLPKSLYPKQLQDLVKWYAHEFKDPMMIDPPAWFKTFIFTEVVFQLPFFFIAAYVFWKGLKKNCWIRIPLIVYSTHVSTVTMTICNHVLTHDFSQSKYPGPETLKERLTLLGVYSPYLFIPVILLFDSLFSSAYGKGKFEREKQKRN